MTASAAGGSWTDFPDDCYEPPDVLAWTADQAAALRAQLPPGRARADVPRYGSPLWHALPEDDPRRMLAALRAAEAWRYDSNPNELTARLEVETAVAREDEFSWWSDVVTLVRGLARTPDQQRLEQLRRQPTGDREVVDTDGWPAVTRPGTWDQWTRTVA